MIIIFSLLLSAFFSGMEIAYVSSNRLNLEIEKNQVGLIPKLLSIITQNPSRFIATMLIGNNFALVIYGIFMGQFIVDNLTFMNLSVMNELTIVLIQTLVSTLVISNCRIYSKSIIPDIFKYFNESFCGSSILFLHYFLSNN